MNAGQELREIIEHLKNLTEVHQEIGMDPPPVPAFGHLQPDPPIGKPAYLDIDTSGGDTNTGQKVGPGSLEDLLDRLRDCKLCKLHEVRNKLVFGEGSPRARLVFVGEGPGRDEDMAGRPFVGEAGRLLTRIIEKGMGLRRAEVYICNVVKCRPPKNRDPEEGEVEACLPFLKEQLALIKPEVICILGTVAGKALLGRSFKISAGRGKWHSYMGIPVMPTYHPAYLLRNPSAKRQVWEDVKKIMYRLGLEVKKDA